MEPAFYSGRRLSYSSTLCTVRYVGQIKDAKGEWLGVEWDDISKGRHPGDHCGVKYFECLSEHPTAGSFIRPTRPFDQALAFLEALQKKYASNGEPPPGAAQRPVEISGKVVEEVGFDKIRKQQATLQKLRIILLDGLCIAGLDEKPYQDGRLRKSLSNGIRTTCPMVTELDLSRNLFEKWEDVVNICGAMPSLKILKLNGNRFRDVDVVSLPPPQIQESFRGIKELSLDNTWLSWAQVTALTSQLLALESLSLSLNGFVSILNPLNIPTLKTLVLSYNNITSFSSIEPLSSLPLLKSLSLRANAIDSLADPSVKVPVFPSLESLDISVNSLSSFSMISHLPNLIPCLQVLRISQNPVVSSLSIEEAFMLTLARIPTLRVLNFSKVSAAERTNAELYYLSRITRELAAAPPSQESVILSDHPRYQALCELHGAPTINRMNDANNGNYKNTLAARLIGFKFYNITGVEKYRRIPPSVNVYRLKSVVGALFGLPPMHLRLVWETEEWDPVGRNLHPFKDGGRDDRWSISSESDEENGGIAMSDELAEGTLGDEDEEGSEENTGRDKGVWVRREVELVDGTKEVGFWIESKEARVRVEIKARVGGKA